MKVNRTGTQCLPLHSTNFSVSSSYHYGQHTVQPMRTGFLHQIFQILLNTNNDLKCFLLLEICVERVYHLNCTICGKENVPVLSQMFLPIRHIRYWIAGSLHAVATKMFVFLILLRVTQYINKGSMGNTEGAVVS